MGIFKRWLKKTWDELDDPVVLPPPDHVDDTLTPVPNVPDLRDERAGRPKGTRNTIRAILKAKGITDKFTLVAVRPYYRDTKGKPGVNDYGIFDDAVFGNAEGYFESFNFNTDPAYIRAGHGTAESTKGMAHLNYGVHLYQIGKHKGYTALVQAEGVTVMRDADSKVPQSQIVIMDGHRRYKDFGWFGINIHRGGTNSVSSIGCQTVYGPQWTEFITDVQYQMKRFGQKTVRYVLITYDEFEHFRKLVEGQAPEPQPTMPKPLKGWVKEYTQFVMENVTPEMIGASKGTLVQNAEDYDQRKLLAVIMQAMAYAESGYDRTTRYEEQGLGKDAVTGLQNTSEGLLQVSYQDAKYYGAKFDWAKDKHLDPKDPNKTIFDPYNNLDCGIRIFTKLLKNSPGISLQAAGLKYWSVLRPERSGYRRFSDEFKKLLRELG